ncbi:hypothetical protein TWF730_007909 [Orbilia blumenaviensis]|uniref:Uncharacterized protein n=1 Tax=Orbilia blumenaviensis TaxID=1796055 RepID=A0AAV9V9V8_9PEZI
MATAVRPTIQIPQLAITDVDSSRPQTPVSILEAEASEPAAPLAKRMDSLKVDDFPEHWRRKRSSSISTMETLPTYSGPGSPTGPSKSRKRSNSVSPSLCSEAPSYRTIPEDHDSTVYHLYRIGGSNPKGGSISIHEVADKSLGALPRATFADGSQRPTPGWWARTFTGVNVRTARKPDNPKFDPRMPTFYVHKPYLPASWKSLPHTLRVGPNKHSPISCRFDGSFAWRKWTFNFEDINGEGVVDERGVVAEDYPRKIYRPGWRRASEIGKETEEGHREADIQQNGVGHIGKKTPCLHPWSPIVKAISRKIGNKELDKGTGLDITKSAPRSESNEEKASVPAPPPPPAVVGVAEGLSMGTEEGGPESKPISKTQSTPALSIDTSKACKITPPATPLTPNRHDRVEMTWENKIGRQYSFTYQGIKFFWKGTSTLKDEHNKKWGALNRYSHLKLVAELPEEARESPPTPNSPKSPCLSPQDAEKSGFLLRRKSSISSISSIFSKKSTTAPKRELVVATYTCTWGKRKAGRLHVDNTAIERLVQILAEASPIPFSPLPRRRSTSFSGDHYLSPDSFSPPTKKRHAHVFPTPRLPDSPTPVDVFERKRLRELVVVTCVAMANGEQEKRHALVEMTGLLIEIAQNAATG